MQTRRGCVLTSAKVYDLDGCGTGIGEEKMVVELISVGTEILLGNIVNTNAAFLLLSERGRRQCGAADKDIADGS